jgi:cobalt/nickel transport system permease protein
MTAGHTQSLYLAGDSMLHRLPAHTKLVATVLTVLAVVAAPREQFWAFAAFAALIGGLAAIAGIPAGVMLRRLAIETPFVAFALMLPFFARGERTDALGLSLSVEGLWGAWELLATATLGVACSILLAATTPLGELLGGLERLRMPTLIVQIMSFMIRYADVVAAELHRMRIARESRGFHARGIRQWATLARGAGAMFVRCFERGERVHLAMLSRGYAGRMPPLDTAGAAAGQWATALTMPAVATAVCVAAWSLTGSVGP